MLTQLLLDGRLQQADIMLFQPFIKKLVGDLDRQYGIIKMYRFNGLEPRLITLGSDTTLDRTETIVPYRIAVLVMLF